MDGSMEIVEGREERLLDTDEMRDGMAVGSAPRMVSEVLLRCLLLMLLLEVVFIGRSGFFTENLLR